MYNHPPEGVPEPAAHFPRVRVRDFSTHDQHLFEEFSRLVFSLIAEFTSTVAGKPIHDAIRLHECLRRGTIGLFMVLGLLSEQFATTRLCWHHSGFSVDYADWNHSVPRRTVEA